MQFLPQSHVTEVSAAASCRIPGKLLEGNKVWTIQKGSSPGACTPPPRVFLPKAEHADVLVRPLSRVVPPQHRPQRHLPAPLASPVLSKACPDSDHRPERIWMSAAHVLEGQTLCSRTWHSSAPFSWPASWWKLPASPQTVRASSLSVVWTWWTSMPPAQAQACVAQAATGTGTRTGASAVSSAGTEPTTVPSAEAGALKWQPPCSWGHSSSARASSSPWPGSSTSSVPVGSPGSSTGETKSLPCSLEKLLR
ncbi:uncharacterized protein C1orf159 homolog isoform X5 [Equus przewalskii]|uniref:Uncharacterized protein C1orf159 homolog isoform X5 n=1 Tax=Equus przewalskii TaxID=9798 RepID=A0ABM4NA25_EQUPR|nr:uncharacterized protein C1orf159 homolog isoform X2 [Equus caballus]